MGYTGKQPFFSFLHFMTLATPNDPQMERYGPGLLEVHVRLCLEMVSAFEVSGLGAAVLGLS